MDDDGQFVEPENYFPVLPMLLVNGCVGIGTGFSTDIPSHNPLDIVSVLKERLSGAIKTLEGVKLTPWYSGFRGSITSMGDDKSWVVKGKYTFMDDDAAHVQITELPVGTWTQKYKQMLEELVSDDPKDKKPLRDIENNNNDLDVNFTLKMDHDAYHEARAYPAEFEKKFQLNAVIRSTNMVAFDSKGKIRRYANIGEILQDFYETRLDAYVRRKVSELKRLDADVLELKARLLFIESILNGKLVISNQDDDKILAGLKALALPPLSAPESADELKAFEYLLRIRIDRIKASAVEELRKQVAAATEERDVLAAKSAETLWLADLEHFETVYSTFNAKKKAIVEEAQLVQAGVIKPIPKKRTYAKKNVVTM
jgi:DNA topoisomerase-2